MSVTTYREAITESMRYLMQQHDHTIMYGLGITDYIGIFGTTKGFTEEFGDDRVFETPIAEDSMTGFALGASLSGLYPIHIHIRVDFMLLAMNQLVNSIAKYRYMYGGLFKAPMLIRAIIGRSWGQGAQHSQSLQALFGHIPGLCVVMPASAHTARETYRYVVDHCTMPVISLEHRLLYDYSFNDNEEQAIISNPLTSFRVREGNDVTIVATSVMVQEAIRSVNFIMERESITADIIDLHCITHPDEDLLIESITKTGRLIVVDTGWESFGVCAEVTRIIAVRAPWILKEPVVCLPVAKASCPTAKTLENWFYPDMGDIISAIYKLCSSKTQHTMELPSTEYIVQVHKHFKGPF